MVNHLMATSWQPRVWLAGFKGMFSFPETDTLQMCKRISVSALMCGCQALLCTVVSQQVSQATGAKNQGTKSKKHGKNILVLGQRGVKK